MSYARGNASVGPANACLTGCSGIHWDPQLQVDHRASATTFKAMSGAAHCTISLVIAALPFKGSAIDM